MLQKAGADGEGRIKKQRGCPGGQAPRTHAHTHTHAHAHAHTHTRPHTHAHTRTQQHSTFWKFQARSWPGAAPPPPPSATGSSRLSHANTGCACGPLTLTCFFVCLLRRFRVLRVGFRGAPRLVCRLVCDQSVFSPRQSEIVSSRHQAVQQAGPSIPPREKKEIAPCGRAGMSCGIWTRRTPLSRRRCRAPVVVVACWYMCVFVVCSFRAAAERGRARLFQEGDGVRGATADRRQCTTTAPRGSATKKSNARARRTWPPNSFEGNARISRPWSRYLS